MDEQKRCDDSIPPIPQLLQHKFKRASIVYDNGSSSSEEIINLKRLKRRKKKLIACISFIVTVVVTTLLTFTTTFIGTYKIINHDINESE